MPKNFKAHEVLSLSMFPELTDKRIQRVAEVVKEFLPQRHRDAVKNFFR
jgi:dTDP-4-amino-4,6-dideoxygalactose transaminase